MAELPGIGMADLPPPPPPPPRLQPPSPPCLDVVAPLAYSSTASHATTPLAAPPSLSAHVAQISRVVESSEVESCTGPPPAKDLPEPTLVVAEAPLPQHGKPPAEECVADEGDSTTALSAPRMVQSSTYTAEVKVCSSRTSFTGGYDLDWQIVDGSSTNRKDFLADGSITSISKIDDLLLCREDDNSLLCGKQLRDSELDLPEDIWCNILSRMPIEDSARSACVSQAFLRSWRHHPNLIFTKETLCLLRNACEKGALASKIDHIMKKHSGTGVKILKLDMFGCRSIDICHLNSWLEIAIAPGIEKPTLSLPLKYKEGGYNFPCSLLFGQSGSSLWYLRLICCDFRPTVGLGCLRSLTKLYLGRVRITEGELGCLLSSSLALQQLELWYCSEIICLKIPCVLEQLSCLTVSSCGVLQMIESKAPNLSTFKFHGELVQLSLGQALQMKKLDMHCSNESNFLCYAITKLPYIAPNVENLTLSSIGEMVNTPMAAAKFLHLKRLEIYLDGDLSPGYDYLSLVSFLDASPALETFILAVLQDEMRFDSISVDALHMRQMPEHKHKSLKNVTILGFCSAKSMVELACHILENATSLECIILDTVFDQEDDDIVCRCSLTSARKPGDCFPTTSQVILEADRGLMAIERYIVEKVPSTVELDVRGPCSRCHILELM